jgi:hypothetical protein
MDDNASSDVRCAIPKTQNGLNVLQRVIINNVEKSIEFQGIIINY